MSIFTKEQFENIVNAKTGYKCKTLVLSEARRYSKLLYDTSIFLSYSHPDKYEVEQAVTFLGLDVYVDRMDETIPESTTGLTTLKIKGNDKIRLLATNSGIKSIRWDWEGNEYLKIYPLPTVATKIKRPAD